MHNLNSIKRWCLLLLFGVISGPGLWAQVYLPSFTQAAGYPGSANTLSNTSTTGWTEIVPPSISTNQWSGPVSIPFAFDFFGTPVTELQASGNGLVTFLSNPGTTPPDPATPASPTLADANMLDSTIAAYWTEFPTSSTGSNDRVYTQTFGTAPNRQFWVKWHSYAWGASGDFYYCAVVLEESTNKIYVVGMYGDPDVDNMPTAVGIKVDATDQFAVSNPTLPGDLGTSTADDNLFEFTYNASSCVPPQNPSVNPGITTATVSGNLFASAVGIEVEYGTPGFSQGAGTVVSNASGNSVSISSLTANTSYDYYVRGDCGGGTFSTWDGPFSFTTLPPALNTFPFVETFDTTSIWSGASVDSTWTQRTDDDLDWEANSGTTLSGSTGPDDDLTGGQYLYIEGSGPDQGEQAILETPVFDVTSLTSPYLTFFYHRYGSDMGDLIVEYSTDFGATWTNGLTLTGQQQQDEADAWIQADVALPSSANVKMRFVGVVGPDFRTDMAIDSVVVGEEPCFSPGFVSVEPALSSTELTVNWTNNSGSFRVEWGVTGFTQGTGTPNTALVTNDTTLTITGLFRNTQYDIYVYGDCSAVGNGTSLIGSPVQGYTLPSVPYVETFDQGYLPDDRWSEGAGDIDNPTVFTSTSSLWTEDEWLNVASSPNQSARLSVSTFTSTASLDDWFFSPLLDLGSGGQYEIAYLAAVTENAGGNASAMQADDTLFVVINTDTSETWNRSDAVQKIHIGNAPTNSGGLYRVDLSSYSGLVQVGFYLGSTVQNTQAYNFFIDNFRLRNIPACAAPTGFATSGITDSSVGVVWDSVPSAGQYIVYLAPQDSSYLSSSAIVDTVALDSAYFTGLMPNTGYDLYINSLCSGSPSAVNGPLNFRTNCISVFTAPYTFDFEDLDVGAAGGMNFDNCLTSVVTNPYEWEVDLSDGSNTNSTGTGPVFDNTLFPNSGGKFLFTEASSGSLNDTTRIVTPLMDLSALTTPGLKFFYHMFGEDMGSLQIDVSTDGSTWQNGYFRISGEQQTAETDPWDSLSLDLSTFGSDTLAVRFTAIRGNGFESDISLDDISFEEYVAPACPVPTNFTLSNVGPTGGDFAWSSSTASVTIAVSSSNDPNDSANTVYFPALTGSSLNVSSLMSNTCYTAYIQGNCTSDSTNWVNATPFCTPCNSLYTAPYTIDFEGEIDGNDDAGTLQNCWSFVQGTSDPVWEVESGSGANKNSPSTGPFYDNTTFGTSGGQYIFMETSSASLGDTAILESPQIYVGALTDVPAIEYYYHMYGADMGKLYVQMREANGPWTTVDSVVGQQQTAGGDAWLQGLVLMPSLTNDTISVRFVGQAGDGFTSDISLDDISIVNAPSCLPPGNLSITNITTSGADVSWTTAADSVTIAVSTNNDPDDSTSTFYLTNVQGTSTTISLDPATCYDIFVRSACATDSSIWVSAGQACTPCPPFYAAPYGPVDFEGEVDGNDAAGPLINCWTFVQGTSDPVWEVEESDGTNKNSLNTGPWYDNTSFGNSGGQYIFTETSAANEGDTAIVESPEIYVGGLSIRPQVEFYYHMYGADMGKLYVNARNAGGSWVTIDSIVGQQQTAGSDAWRVRSSIIDGFNDTIQIRFVGVAGPDFESDMALDDISIIEAPACPAPSGLSASNVGNTSADVAWSTFNPGATVQVEYGAEGFTLGSGTMATVTGNPASITGLTSATCYDVYLREICTNGDTSDWIGPVSFCTTFTCGPIAGPGLPSDTFICTPNTLTLSGASNDIYWEDDNGDIYFTGSPFVSDTIGADTSFYARAFEAQLTRTFGPSTNIATAGFGNFSNGQMITVNEEVSIDTVTLRSDGARTGTIQFSIPGPGFSNSTVVDFDVQQSVEYNVQSAGEHRVPVGVVLKPGQYFVNLTYDTTNTGEFFRATSGASYPYEFESYMSIDSAVGVSNIPEVRVYYFFDWTVSAVCSSPLDTTMVEFAPEAVAAFTENSASGSATATEYSVFFDAAGSENAVSYDWDFGDGNSGVGDTITHDFTQNGTYTVTLVVTGVCGDTDTATATVNIQGISVEEVAFNGQVNVYPNPTSGVFNIDIETATNSEATIELASLSGQTLFTEKLDANTQWLEQVDIRHLPAGTYVLSIRTADGIHVQRVIRQ